MHLYSMCYVQHIWLSYITCLQYTVIANFKVTFWDIHIGGSSENSQHWWVHAMKEYGMCAVDK
jgi:hypothetical protein